MTQSSFALSRLSLPVLSQVLTAIERGRIECPITEIDLVDQGLARFAPDLLGSLQELSAAGCALVLRAVIAERMHHRPPRIDLVWSGPDAHGSQSRDTALVLQGLFESAQASVLIAGYAFDRAEILRPLFEAMRDRSVKTQLFIHLEPTAPSAVVLQEYATRAIDQWVQHNWPFGAPYPEIYYDPRTVLRGPPWASMHAKCIVVDLSKTLVTSANFTDRGQTRNIEVGVVIEDEATAKDLTTQWQLLIRDELVLRYRG
jgi:phosphatidylserine/phosphatidylglycerophosphate/cardiolipin synthase-like enzyme